MFKLLALWFLSTYSLDIVTKSYNSVTKENTFTEMKEYMYSCQKREDKLREQCDLKLYRIPPEQGVIENLIDSLESCWNLKPDFVVVSTPTKFHSSLSIDASNHGVNVFVEKPGCVTFREAQDMQETFIRNDTSLFVSFQRRFHPLVNVFKNGLFDIGNIIISGYTNVTEFVGGSLSGEVTIQVGPLQEKMISAVPEHEHAILTSSAPQAGAFEGGGGPVDDHAVGFKDSNGQVNFFLPSGGVPLFHAHGIVDYVIQDPNLSTFGNVGGIGEKFFATFTQAQIGAGGVFNVPSHDLNTGNMIRVVSNSQSTQLSFSVNGVSVNFSPQSIWWVIKVDDDNFLLAGSKYLALTATPLVITNGGSSGEITIETGYQIAGNLPAEVIKIITTPSPTTWDIDDNYTIGGKTVQLPGDTTTNLSIKVSENSNGTYTVPAPAADEVPILAIETFRRRFFMEASAALPSEVFYFVLLIHLKGDVLKWSFSFFAWTLNLS